MDVNTADRGEQRKFGIVMAVAIMILALIRWWLHGFGAFPMGFAYVAAAFAGLGLVAPRALAPVFRLWIRFSLALNWLMTRVLLTLAFFLLIMPTRVVIAVLRKDLLSTAWDPEALTYWEEPEEQPAEPARYFNQF